MKFGICLLSVVPVRLKPTDTSEMTTQLLLGDTVTVIEKKSQWLKIKMSFDNYEGWMDEKQLTPISNKEWLLLKKSKQHILFNQTKVEIISNHKTINALSGSCLHLNNGASLYYNPTNNVAVNKPNKIAAIAQQFIGAPYLWGGRTLYGIDCSGFSQVVYKIYGATLFRDASQQVKQGVEISFSNIKEGDLAFFHNASKKITHIGICLNQGAIIHASGEVRIDKLTSIGILNSETNKITHQLNCIRRV